MFQNWLKPLAKPLENSAARMPEHSLGRQLVPFSKAEKNLKKVKIALIGLEESQADVIRKELYRFAFPFPEASIADLGNLRKANEPSLLIPVLFELLSGNVIPVLIGGKDPLAKAQFLAYQEAKALVNMAVIDQSLRFFPSLPQADVYSGLLEPRHPLLFHFSLLGYQSHLMPENLLEWLEKQHVECYRLGRSRPAIEDTEPTIRDADLMAFHLSALKQQEAPGVDGASPSGYFLEEACQLARYAGMSDKLSSFGVYGFQRQSDRESMSAQAVAQLVWYFMDGVFNRKNDYPVSKTSLTEYVVDYPQMNYQLSFWKSGKSGRWWMQIPDSNNKRKYQRHRLIPCSYTDYQAACREELPDRLMQALDRFG
ncbi:MAG: hypothetical protein R2792_13235 [Saprospiraceae bacterium]